MLFARTCWSHANRPAVKRRGVRHHTASTSGLNAVIHGRPSLQDGLSTPFTSALSGKAVAIKDNIVTGDLPTTAASRALTGYTSPFEATVVKLLREHGAVIFSKTNLDEFGMGSHSLHSHHDAVSSLFSRNGKALSAGGSSGGSAVEVARGACWAALGTDTGGSVRLPAAYCGVVGFKPSYGLLSRWGVLQYANSLDTVGVIAGKVRDARDVFTTLNKWDGKDPTSLGQSVRDRILDRRGGRQGKGLRIGVPVEYNIEELSPIVRQAYIRNLHALQRQGHTVRSIALPTTRHALSAYYVLAPAEASSNLAKYDGVRYGHRTAGPDALPKASLPLYAQTRGEAFGDEVKRRILLGAYTLSSEAMNNYFIQAQRVRRLVQQDFDRVFALSNPLTSSATPEKHEALGVDVLLTPTAPALPPTLDEVQGQSSVESYMNDVFTVPASLAGLPAISVPVKLDGLEKRGLDENDVRTSGMQLIGQFGDDQIVLEAAEVLEKAQQQWLCR
ncbi:Amidase [Teratosphaeria destructans]|uniref:Glutamyl-tRNA(Gln) amidotransferase subunit A, mitochondrial n=1 Tax=Teratosphaeria destructans TaxID=418781 RepID=A0A9W7VZ73_9PEZI|nr:Amidase [Teratosphaeria destructans]